MAEQRAGEWVYAGFWIRVWASIIDSALLLLVVFPLLSLVVPGPSGAHATGGRLIMPNGRIDYGALTLMPTLPGPLHILLYWVLPAVVVIIFWLTREATPGKMAIRARVVDARSGERLAPGQSILRYLGYYVSTIPLGLGLIWVGIDPRKQGWHDKLARTVVVRRPRRIEAVRFDAPPAAPKPHTGWKND
ncbi:RDD family protein [Salinisphaera sp.]|uniref:RDD family protein n=1 Tax=Salinisphaera sp. TaxID=1914330 RepID=UPI002D79B127|nr:RDD family protein [Salinisphaera sp.]HET7314875.1 RDD family protein [Salinisphaera sp.]